MVAIENEKISVTCSKKTRNLCFCEKEKKRESWYGKTDRPTRLEKFRQVSNLLDPVVRP